MQPKQNPSVTRRVVWIVAIAVVVTALTITLYKSRHQVFPKRFAEVEPGRLYRSGQSKTWPLKRTLEHHNIRTIVTMMNATDDDVSLQEQEQALAEERGIAYVRIPMHRNGCGPFDDLEKAAAILAGEPVDGKVYPHPVLLHCAAGVCRTGSSYAVWRMKYCGWDADRAIAEANTHGKIDPRMVPHLQEYYRERVATARSEP